MAAMRANRIRAMEGQSTKPGVCRAGEDLAGERDQEEPRWPIRVRIRRAIGRKICCLPEL
jgi:hypothetical protein